MGERENLTKRQNKERVKSTGNGEKRTSKVVCSNNNDSQKTGKSAKVAGRMHKNPFNKIINQIKAIIVIKFIN